MHCPSCDSLISHVNILSHCHQRGYLEGNTNRVGDYNQPEVLDTIEIHCPKCDDIINGYVEEY